MIMENWLEREERMIGSEAVKVLASSHVAVFGIGGVGGHAVLSLARAGVGELTIVDRDTVDETNLNRQAVALRSTVGRKKADVMKDMIADINPDCTVNAIDMFYLPETASQIDLGQFDYVIDAVDTVTAKLCLVEKAIEAGVPIVCSMGTGNRLDPSKLKIIDISKTKDDPLARDMRRELRARGINHLDVCWSEELPVRTGTQAPGSVSFVPSAAGLLLASHVVRGIINTEQ